MNVDEARRLGEADAEPLIRPGRVNVFERWESAAAVAAFRGDGPSEEQGSAMLSASVTEFEVESSKSLT